MITGPGCSPVVTELVVRDSGYETPLGQVEYENRSTKTEVWKSEEKLPI